MKYVPGITDWLRIGDLREEVYRVKAKGAPFRIVGNLSVACQRALLKILEEIEDAEITTSQRFNVVLESRCKVVGTCVSNCSPKLLGLGERDGVLGECLTSLMVKEGIL